ncbi:MAG: hypothetical protein NTV49_01330 [Kiritimatiellaeota bacterium]|nr:hypothetical protein [Kiritimatiellota bacterium]
MSQNIARRKFLRGSLLATAGSALALGVAPAARGVNKPAEPVKIVPQGDGCPQGKLGKLQLSRLIMGCNLITNYIHRRDLTYISNLARHYNTDEKILDTLAMAESRGINTIMLHADERCLGLLQQHRLQRGGKLQWVVAPPITGQAEDDRAAIGQLAEAGADALYIHGVQADKFCFHGKRDVLVRALECIKQHDLPAGVAGHDLNVVKFCEQHDVGADFYVKTFHHHNYPTAPKPEQLKTPQAEIPGYWCQDPTETAAVMRGVKKPWIAFKVMAAGAIPPESAFNYAFRHGADFVLAGMFDFEMAEDVDLARAAVAAAATRERTWCD